MIIKVTTLGSTAVACILLITLTSQDLSLAKSAVYPSTSLVDFFLSYGTIYFAFGGATSFPTFQKNMKNQDDFPKAITIGLIFLLFLYLPVACLGYITYGNRLKTDVLLCMSPSIIKSITEVLFVLHMVVAFPLVIIPTSQEFEEFLKIPNEFGWKRVAIRSSMMVFIIFAAESLPYFGKVRSLVGGSAVTLTCSVFPCLFYYALCSQKDPNWPERYIPLHEKFCLIASITCGIIGGSLSTYASIIDIVQTVSFQPPCYVNLTAAGLSNSMSEDTF
ncbi:aa_trans domain-containing protein [Caerostris darwini]|uniref:Aa_trans domain-containing protein n=1 Tax=Caerostris darwini TaxID=1538125 RepID=A0AAV4WZT9_9ARAC|nr:aa_trans domain-containing protein [Caerostris darwini]